LIEQIHERPMLLLGSDGSQGRPGGTIRDMFKEPFPILHVDDVERSVRFYRDLFGFQEEYRWPEEGEAGYVYLRMGETGLGIATRSEPPLPDWPEGRATGQFQLCISSDDTDAAVERLTAGGARAVTEPHEMPWGEKIAFLEDPDGNLIHVNSTLG
jgi:lactoylglutathione lyase